MFIWACFYSIGLAAARLVPQCMWCMPGKLLYKDYVACNDMLLDNPSLFSFHSYLNVLVVQLWIRCTTNTVES